MKTKLIKLKDEEILNYYTKFVVLDFPNNETYSANSISNYIKSKSVNMYLFVANKTVIGWALLLLDKQNMLASLEYLAIFKEFRNLGYGSKFLNDLKNKYKNYNAIYCDVEAVETENKEIKQKRQNFYLNNGMIKTNLETMCWQQHYNYFYMPIKKIKITSDEIFASRMVIYKINYTDKKLKENFFRLK